jgi:hypothetical protein
MSCSAQQRRVERVTLRRLRQRAEHLRPARGVLALQGGVEFGAVGRELGQAIARAVIAFVGHVVGQAREAVDGGHGRAQRRRAQPGGDGEVLVVVDRGTERGNCRGRGAVRMGGAGAGRGMH